MFKSLFKSFFSPNDSKSSQPVPRSITRARLHAARNHRILRWEDGTFYDGQCANGTVLSGFGKLCLPNGEFYEGQFQENQFHGQGRYVHTDGSYYEGDWSHDIKEGSGKEVSRNGAVYTGNFQKGLKNGSGVMSWKDGSFYEGQFRDDQINGLGRMTYGNGVIYYGWWANNSYEGEGELRSRGVLHKGTFRNGVKHGKGVQIDLDTEIRIEGEWENNELVGAFLLFEEGRVRSAKSISDTLHYLTDEQYQAEEGDP